MDLSNLNMKGGAFHDPKTSTGSGVGIDANVSVGRGLILVCLRSIATTCEIDTLSESGENQL